MSLPISKSNDDYPAFKHANIDQLLTQFASTWTLDSIYLFLIAPFGVLGFILNLLSFFILNHSEFNKVNIYGYFKVITINSALLCLIQSTLFISLTYRYFAFSNTYEANFYGTYIYIPVSNVFLLYGSLLDMCISIERSSIFYPKLKALSKHKPYIVCLILFIISILIGLPYFFINCPLYYDAPYFNNTFIRLWYWDITEFGRSLVGQILTYANFFVRDVVFLLIELFLNIFAIVLFKNYFKNKARLLGKNNLINQTLVKSNNDTNSSETPNNAIAQTSQTSKVRNKASQTNNLSSQEKNLTIMIMIMCFLSIIIHLFYLVVATLLFFNNPILTSGTGSFVSFTCTLKHLSNIIFLYLFNVNFRNKVKKMFTIC